MSIHPKAGEIAPKSVLVNLEQLESCYYHNVPDVNQPTQRVAFGTSGHRGTSLDSSFTESHILVICQAICDYRTEKGYSGTLFLGKDTHFLSLAAQKTAIEVFAGNQVKTSIQKGNGYTPTPVISHAILGANRGKTSDLADGVVITPSHNPPQDGGIKYNPPNGGPADTDVTNWIQNRANDYLQAELKGVRRLSLQEAMQMVSEIDYTENYVADLANIIDMESISSAGLRIGVNPLGGAGHGYWKPIAKRYNLNISIVNDAIDPTFSFMTLDHDGKIRMDCSSPFAMKQLVALKDEFDLAFANDPDTDRHGIVVPSVGLMNPNHYLSVAIAYLFTNRPRWNNEVGIGKTLVSSGMIDRVAQKLGRKLIEVPVGFKWFVDGLYTGKLGFGGEESAGASFLRFDGTVWSTDKDGIILNLLAAEILAKMGRDPGILYQELEKELGQSFYTRVDCPTSQEKRDAFKSLVPERVTAEKLAGDMIIAKLTRAPGNNAPVGGLKVVSTEGWFAARPSGTENIYKIYAESFRSQEHLATILQEAEKIVDAI
ncbi:MAG: phosphoglucomutase (alpha-D-glucose-1,6-bisphosphate-dependent) [Thermoguttaceae bacterium]